MGKTIKVGIEKKIAGLGWKVLDVTEKGVLCLAEKILDDMQFDKECNDWRSSDLRDYLNTEFYRGLADEIGEDNIIPFKRNLLSLDGQTEYGICEEKVSLLNVDEYRQYRKLIPNADYWWWLLTAWSTKCNGDTILATVVSPLGDFNFNLFDNDNGVRPLCIFSPAIFESEG